MIKATLALGGALVLVGCTAGDRVTLLDPIQAEKLAICQGLASGEIEPVTDPETGVQTPICDRGAVAVLDNDLAALEQEEYEARFSDETAVSSTALLTGQNQQAFLRERGPRVRALDEAPDGSDLMAELPLEVASERFGFEIQSSKLSDPVVDDMVSFVVEQLEAHDIRYPDDPPGLNITIAGLSDPTNFSCDWSSAEEEYLADLEALQAGGASETTLCNMLLSKRRAATAFYQLDDGLKARGIDINVESVVEAWGVGDLLAIERRISACQIAARKAETDPSVCNDIEQYRIKEDFEEANEEYRAVVVTFR